MRLWCPCAPSQSIQLPSSFFLPDPRTVALADARIQTFAGSSLYPLVHFDLASLKDVSKNRWGPTMSVLSETVPSQSMTVFCMITGYHLESSPNFRKTLIPNVFGQQSFPLFPYKENLIQLRSVQKLFPSPSSLWISFSIFSSFFSLIIESCYNSISAPVILFSLARSFCLKTYPISGTCVLAPLVKDSTVTPSPWSVFPPLLASLVSLRVVV